MDVSSIFIVVTAVLGSLLEIIDTSIVAVAQPRMQGNLGVTLDEISWVSTGYIISNAVVLPIASWLANKIGRRTYFVGCITIFTITSMICGLAPNFAVLIAARVIQGAAGGALLPTSQTLIQEQFPGKKAGIGSAIYGMSVMIGPALGPTLGGYLTDNYSWRSIFYINLPIGILAAVMALIFIPSEKKDQKGAKAKEKGSADWGGFLLLIAGIGCLQFVLERGQQDDWFNSNLILGASFVMAISLPLFYIYEYRRKKPIVDVKLFADSPIRTGTMLMAAVGLVLYSLVFIVPVYMDRQVGMDATHTGYLYIPGSIATMLVMPIVGKFLQKLGVKFFVSVGGILICGCLWMMSNFTTGVGAPDLFWPLMLRGLGLGCLFVPINAAVLSQYEGEKLGQAAGLLNLFRQIGGSFGIAGMSTFLDRYSAQYRNNLRSQVNYSNPVAIQSIEKTTQSLHSKLSLWHGLSPGSIGLEKASTAGIGGLQGRLESQVFQLAFNRLMLLVFSVYLLSIFPLWRMKLRKKVGAVQAH